MFPSAIKSGSLVDQALIAAAATSGALLAGAHIFQYFGYAPCALCLDQRQAHWTGLGLALAGVIFSAGFKWRRAAIATAGACALVYLFSSGLAFYHAGVENHFWPGPATCSGGGPVDIGEGSLLDIIGQKPSGPSCSDAAWRFLGVSMAGYNLLFSAGLFSICLIAAALAARDARNSSRHAQRIRK
ncbi:MAG: disulfide bond formation protein B [Parvularculaceae bacterium]